VSEINKRYNKSKILLLGVTAVGKGTLAFDLAGRLNAEIISVDSMKVYRRMDIGTAKPTRAELARVPHHLIDTQPVTDQMDITRYVELARAAVADIAARGRRILVAGGSGFYLKAFFAPVADAVAVPPELRARVAALDLAAQLGVLLDVVVVGGMESGHVAAGGDEVGI